LGNFFDEMSQFFFVGFTNPRLAIAIDGMATAIPVGANPEHPLTEQQIRRLLDGLNALPPRMPIRDVLEQERYGGLSCLQSLWASCWWANG
jgi:hypothetical protein